MIPSSQAAIPITVLLADDYPVTRAGIRAILESASDIRVVGEAGSGYEVQEMVAELKPRILILDLQMPGPRPADLERWVRENYPETDTLVLTGHGRDAYLAVMMEAGVSGFLEKSEPVQNLIAAIRRTAHGEFLFDATQRKRAQAWNQDAGAKWASLSDREKEVLQWVAKGMNNAAIAKVMDISPKTVAFHVTGILKKLGVSSRNEAIVWVSQYAPIHLE